MDFRKLQAFARVYDLQSFSKAGKDLFLSQPTISTHVLSLEDQLGVKLFDRIGRTVMPTQAGQVLYSGVQRMFRMLEETKADIHDLKNQVCGQVVVGGSTIPSNYLLPSVIADFRKKYPEVCIDLRVGDSIKVCQDVLAGELDFGMVGGFADHFDLEHGLLMRDLLDVVVSPEMKLNISGQIRPEDLKTIPWVLREKGSGTRQAFENSMIDCGISLQELKTSTMVQSTEALVRCVLAGVGAGVTSRLAVKKHLESGELVSLDVKGLNIKRNFYIIRHKRRTLFTCANILIDNIKSHIRDNGYKF
ncbi:selenium metabolism-associated LysR family transcriptional regulator [Desulfonatronovibrio hydrogenovorans]|uniref:selenium metabolism-associated LysR family transcriptional regulator n=1 Tax=Desulfonatronovibrio hydrogenovorans TaxID=53245 RepID=UPI0004906DE0|nr:selenium metabolism-associated LysR family transcriptional regulator [Desulfonatronovibrio hydrogenovorans]